MVSLVKILYYLYEEGQERIKQLDIMVEAQVEADIERPRKRAPHTAVAVALLSMQYRFALVNNCIAILQLDSLILCCSQLKSSPKVVLAEKTRRSGRR